MVAAACVASVSAQDRVWKHGTWAAAPDARTYAIDTSTEIITAVDPERRDARAVSVTEGAPVSFVLLDAGPTLVVRDSANTEHRLVFLSARKKYTTDYAAAGPGHFIKAVTADGASITLEDGSRWDIDPLARFGVTEWAPLEMISIRRSTDDPDFGYEIDNTSRDDGALGNYRKN
jgi:hypothetical protein